MSSVKKRKKGRQVSFARSSLRTTHCTDESNFINTLQQSPTPRGKSRSSVISDMDSWLTQSVKQINKKKKSRTARSPYKKFKIRSVQTSRKKHDTKPKNYEEMTTFKQKLYCRLEVPTKY